MIGALLAASITHAAPGPNTPATIDKVIADARDLMMVSPQAASKAAASAAAQLANAQRRDRDWTLALATTDWLRAEAAFRLGQLDRASSLIDAAAAGAGSDKTQLAGDILLTRGSIRGARAEVGAALRDFQAAFVVFRHVGNTRSQAIALMQIASLYGDGMDSAGALRYLTQATEVYRGDSALMVALYNNRAGALQDLGRHEEAERQFRSALAYAERLQSPVLIAQVLRNMARNRLKAGQVAAAEQAVRRSLAVAASGEAASSRPQLLALAAEAAYQRGELGQAEALIRQSFFGVDVSTGDTAWREPHATAYRIFSRQGEYALAFAHLAALKRIDDRATKVATSTGNALRAARFDFANQELRIAKLRAEQLRRDIAQEQARARVQQVFFTGAAIATAVVILLLAIGLFTIRRSRNAVRAARDGLAVTNVALGKALAAKTEFLATTSHEIRTPLNGILGMTQVMLTDATLAPGTRERLTIVQGAGLTMRALVDDILDVAKMETGNLTIEEAPFDPAAALNEAAGLWRHHAEAKGLQFHLDLGDLPGQVVGDVARLRQIVFNLLSNAVKFTERGSVTLSARAERDTRRIVIAVADTGIGIAPDKHATVFEAFRQADTSTTRQHGGTGLGLSICQSLVEAMGGSITLDSRPDEGARFVVTLPLVEPDAAVAAPTPDVSESNALLVLDRNPIMRSMWRTLLERHAGDLVFAATIEEAVARMGAGGIAVLLVDDATLIAVPDAPAAADALATAARDAHARSYLLWNAEREGGAALAAEMTGLIEKPVAGSILIAVLRNELCDEAQGKALVSDAA